MSTVSTSTAAALFVLAFLLGSALTAALLWTRAGRKGGNPRNRYRYRTVNDLDPKDRVLISRLLAEGKKLEAIKHVRQHTGLGLAEAKDLIERK